MKNLTVKAASRSIEVSKSFNTLASRYGTDEYKALQEVRRDYPGYKVVVVATRKSTKNNKPSFKGLTYEYMETYIMSHGTAEVRIANLRELNEMRLIAECHSKAFRYPVVKAWFLDKYPEVKNFGMKVARFVKGVFQILTNF